MKHFHGKSNSDNIILVKPFPGAHTKAMKHYVSPDLEKKTDLVILHTGTNYLNSVSSPVEIANEIITLALSVKENGQQTAVSGIILKKLRVLNPRAHLNQDWLQTNRKGQYVMGNIFSSFINKFYF